MGGVYRRRYQLRLHRRRWIGTTAGAPHTEVYPDSPSGLGDGTLAAVLDGVTYAFTLDASSRGIYEDSPAGDRVVTFYLSLTPPGGISETT